MGMKVVIAIDSFKGSLSSREAAEAVKLGVLRADPLAEVAVCPLADGGEGTTEALLSCYGGERISVKVTDPLGYAVNASYGILPEDRFSPRTAVIEMSAASGLPLVPERLRDPLNTTSFGTGELMRHAIETMGCKKIILGIGGSATNDGGIGMLSALGYRFLDGAGRTVPTSGKGLRDIRMIDGSEVPEAIRKCEISVASDVDNPLLGERGCSRVYAPQKGADRECVEAMEGWLKSFADLTAEYTGSDERDTPGAGAAGGLGFALVSYLGAELKSGAELILEASGIAELLSDADLLITGEGRLDRQTAMGKAPMKAARLAKQLGAATLALGGSVGEGAEALNGAGIDACLPILKSPSSLCEAMRPETAATNLSFTAEQAIRLFRAGGARSSGR